LLLSLCPQGPGLAIRIIGDVTREKLDILRQADVILIDEYVGPITTDVS
jgi:GMP synthase PP-ATPase subunit